MTQHLVTKILPTRGMSSKMAGHDLLKVQMSLARMEIEPEFVQDMPVLILKHLVAKCPSTHLASSQMAPHAQATAGVMPLHIVAKISEHLVAKISPAHLSSLQMPLKYALQVPVTLARMEPQLQCAPWKQRVWQGTSVHCVFWWQPQPPRSPVGGS